MNRILRIVFILLSTFLGIIFLYSAWTKLDTLQKFEYTLVEYLHFSWLWAAIGARLLIGMEAGLGVLLTFNLFGKNKWVLKLAVASLAIFSVYLIFLWMHEGNNVNCGCFGDKIAMTPSESLLKNAVMLIVLILIWKLHNGLLQKKYNIIWLSVFAVMLFLPLVIYTLPDTQPQWLKKEQFKLNTSSLYTPGKADAPTINVDSGKYIISFFSLGCPHCRIAAYKMHLMKENNPSLPFFMVLAGKEENKAGFWQETKAQNIPYTTLEADSFTNLVGWRWPVIYWVNNGWVEAQTNYITLNQQEIEHWLQTK
jgi:hypothetical protein